MGCQAMKGQKLSELCSVPTNQLAARQVDTVSIIRNHINSRSKNDV